MSTLYNFVQRFWVIVITLLVAIILLFQIVQNGPTTDEPAHIGAAYGYSNGVALNPEHPPLMKVMNSVLFSTIFSGKLSTEREQYKIGWDILGSRQGRSILELSRALYAAIFVLSVGFILWLAHRQHIDSKIANIIYAVVVTSPLLISQAGLVTFDVIAGVSTLNFLLVASCILAKKTFSLELMAYLWLWFAVGITVKFSLVLLIIPLIAVYGVLLFRNSTLCVILLKSLARGFLAAFALLFSLCLYAFRASSFTLPNDQRVPSLAVGFLEKYHTLPAILQRLGDPLLWYISGLGRTFARSSDTTSQFLVGGEFHGNYGQFFALLYPFKENPVVVILLLGSLMLSLIAWGKFRSQFFLNTFIILLPVIIFVCSYSYFAVRSNLLLGLRHYYPVLILVYAGIAGLGYLLYNYITTIRKSLVLVFCLLIFTNLLVATQGLSYVSPLWIREKWQVANDSSFIWGQDTSNALTYVHDQKLLRPDNAKEWTLYLPWRTLDIQQYSQFLHWDGSYSDYIIQDRSYTVTYTPRTRYLLVDAEVLQKQYLRDCPKGCSNYLQSYSPWKEYNLIHTFRNTVFLLEKK